VRTFESGKWRVWHVDCAGVLAVLALTTCAYAFGIRPLVERRQEESERARELQGETAKRAELEAALRASAARLADTQRFLTAHQLVLRSTTALNAQLARLTALATGAGLQVDSLEPGREEPGPNCTAVSIRLAGRGDYRTLIKFLGELRAQAPDSSVVQFSLSAPPSPSHPTVAFGLSIVWYAAPKGTLAQR